MDIRAMYGKKTFLNTTLFLVTFSEVKFPNTMQSHTLQCLSTQATEWEWLNFNHYREIKEKGEGSSRDSNPRPCASADTTLLASFFRRPRPGEVAV